MEKVINRRSVLKGIGSASTVAVPLALTASTTKAAEIDQEKYLDHLIAIAKSTGLSMDDLHAWFEGIDLTVIAERVSNWRSRKTFTLAEFHYRNFSGAMNQFARERGAETWSIDCCAGQSRIPNKTGGACAIRLGRYEVGEGRKPRIAYYNRSVAEYRFWGVGAWPIADVQGAV